MLEVYVCYCTCMKTTDTVLIGYTLVFVRVGKGSSVTFQEPTTSEKTLYFNQ